MDDLLSEGINFQNSTILYYTIICLFLQEKNRFCGTVRPLPVFRFYAGKTDVKHIRVELHVFLFLNPLLRSVWMKKRQDTSNTTACYEKVTTTQYVCNNCE